MKDEILIRYINKHCTATEEKEILEWLKEKDNRQRLFELEQIWGLKAAHPINQGENSLIL